MILADSDRHAPTATLPFATMPPTCDNGFIAPRRLRIGGAFSWEHE